jgi:hypothetical protein
MLIGKKRKGKRVSFMQGNYEIQRRIEEKQWDVKYVELVTVNKEEAINKLEAINKNQYKK